MKIYFAWKFAKRGFFKFKENIPKINQRILENYLKNNFYLSLIFNQKNNLFEC